MSTIAIILEVLTVAVALGMSICLFLRRTLPSALLATPLVWVLTVLLWPVVSLGLDDNDTGNHWFTNPWTGGGAFQWGHWWMWFLLILACILAVIAVLLRRNPEQRVAARRVAQAARITAILVTLLALIGIDYHDVVHHDTVPASSTSERESCDAVIGALEDAIAQYDDINKKLARTSAQSPSYKNRAADAKNAQERVEDLRSLIRGTTSNGDPVVGARQDCLPELPTASPNADLVGNCGLKVKLTLDNYQDGIGSRRFMRIEWEIDDPNKQSDNLVGATHRYTYSSGGIHYPKVSVTDMFGQTATFDTSTPDLARC